MNERIVPIEEGETTLAEVGTGSIEPVEDERAKQASTLLCRFRRRRAAWLGHFRSFLGVNAGLAAINILSSMGTGGIYPWFLFVTASWGIGLTIHGLNYHGWLKDNSPSIEHSEHVLDTSRFGAPLLESPGHRGQLPSLPAGGATPPSLPEWAELDDGGWPALVSSCRDAVDAAQRALEEAEASPDAVGQARGQLAGVVSIVEVVQRGALAIRRAINEVAPEGVDTLERELSAMAAKITDTSDERLSSVHRANLKLLEARRERIEALESEEERMRATIHGFLIAVQNIRLDATRLGASASPGLVASLTDSLDLLNAEVDVARQVEQELEQL